MVYTYIGKGTIIPGIKNKRVEELKPGDKILGFYIGFGRKRHAESRIKSVRLVGQSSCIKVGSLSEPALIYPKQLTVGPGFKFTNIEKTVYSVSRITPKPYLINKDVDNIEIYEIILEDDDVVPLLTAYMFTAFTKNPINFQIGGIDAKKNSDKQSEESDKQSRQTESENEKKEKPKTRRKSKSKRKSKSNE